jgi:regulatory protein
VPRSRRPPPRLDPVALDRAAQDYLARWFTTRAHLRVLLLRRVDRSVEAHGDDRAALVAALDATLDRLQAAGVLDDAAYTQSKVRSMVRRGVSQGQAQQRLAAKGVSAARVREGFDAVRADGVDPAMSAACAYVRRRRLGPFRLDPDVRAANRERDLAALGRAGFPYGVARAALDLPDADAVERRILG